MKHILPILLCTALAFGCQKKDINGNNPVKDDEPHFAMRLQVMMPKTVGESIYK